MAPITIAVFDPKTLEVNAVLVGKEAEGVARVLMAMSDEDQLPEELRQKGKDPNDSSERYAG
jgi:hypothetical protein